MINGLTYREAFLDEETECRLLDIVDSSEWMTDLKRRVQHYGYRYDYKARAVDESMFLGELPAWAMEIGSRLVTEQLFPKMPDQLIVNEYQPGQGISAHIDCEPCFQDTIASITLGSGCSMDFTSVSDNEKRSVYLDPRSVVILSGEARYEWRHAIAGRKSDLVGDQRISRARRVSLTFRNVLLNSCDVT